MAFIFSMRSTPRASNSMHQYSRNLTTSSSLPAIAEDRDSFAAPGDTPPVPPRATNRPPSKAFGLQAPPIHYEGSPPQYSLYASPFDGTGVEGPHGEKLEELRMRKGLKDNKHIARRGGWKTLAIIALIVLLCIVGLVVGLVVGLRKHNSTKSANSSTSGGDTSGGTTSGGNTSGGGSGTSGGASGTVPPPTTNPASNTTFPAGSYSIETFLDTIATNCTSNPATWLCYPYSTYAMSPSASAATFDWVISPVPNSPNYTISSTDNPFSLMFANASLALMNAGQDDEHYFFQLMMSKPTKPTVPLTSSNLASTCYFNQTTFHAYLYTKMPKSYPNNGTNTTDTQVAFTPWPYMAKVEQVAASGAGTPTCLDPSGNVMGDFSVSDPTQLCDCLYLNTGT